MIEDSFQIYSRPRAGLGSGDMEMIQNSSAECDPFPVPSTLEDLSTGPLLAETRERRAQ